jgi:hypothetical protein
MKTATIYLRTLAAVATFQAVKDVRYYLNCVMVEPRKDGGIRCVATDGHALAFAGDTQGEASLRVLLPTDAVTWALKQKGEFVTLAYDGFTGTLTAESGAVIPVALVDGHFPDWQAVVPVAVGSGEPLGAVNVELYARLDKAGKGMKNAGVGGYRGMFPVSLYGQGSDRSVLALVNTNKDALTLGVVIMPCRDSLIPADAVAGMLA